MTRQERNERIEEGMRLIDAAVEMLDPILTSGQRRVLNQVEQQLEGMKCSSRS